jgi:hypothetical protein
MHPYQSAPQSRSTSLLLALLFAVLITAIPYSQFKASSSTKEGRHLERSEGSPNFVFVVAFALALFLLLFSSLPKEPHVILSEVAHGTL